MRQHKSLRITPAMAEGVSDKLRTLEELVEQTSNWGDKWRYEGKMNLLQKLTIDWLRALGSWLWANFVVAIMAFLDRLTFRRIVFYVGILIIAMAATQLLSIDLAIIFAGDAMFYFEIASAVYLVAARGHVRQALQIAARVIRQAVQNLPNTFSRFGSRQRRNDNALDRKKGTDNPKCSDDEPAAWIGGIYAIAGP
jgi:hypothetical protein